MRSLLLIILASLLTMLFQTSQAEAAATFCRMDGPRNCQMQIEDHLLAITHNTVTQIQLSQTPHPFRTQNDDLLEVIGRHSAEMNRPEASENSGINAR